MMQLLPGWPAASLLLVFVHPLVLLVVRALVLPGFLLGLHVLLLRRGRPPDRRRRSRESLRSRTGSIRTHFRAHRRSLAGLAIWNVGSRAVRRLICWPVGRRGPRPVRRRALRPLHVLRPLEMVRHGRRRILDHHRPVRHLRRRTRRVAAAGSVHTRPLRRCGWRSRHRSRRRFPGRHINHASRNRPCIHKRIVRNHGQRVRRNTIHIRDVLNITVVIDIDDGRAVHDRVRDVHVSNVSFADAIRRHKHFPQAEREPAYAASRAYRNYFSGTETAPIPPERESCTTTLNL